MSDVPLPEPVAHMYPSDLKRFETNETFATTYSVAVGNPDERSVPLHTLSQLVAYADAVSAAENARLREALGALMHALDESDLVHDDQRKAFKEAREVLKGASHE